MFYKYTTSSICKRQSLTLSWSCCDISYICRNNGSNNFYNMHTKNSLSAFRFARVLSLEHNAIVSSYKLPLSLSPAQHMSLMHLCSVSKEQHRKPVGNDDHKHQKEEEEHISPSFSNAEQNSQYQKEDCTNQKMEKRNIISCNSSTAINSNIKDNKELLSTAAEKYVEEANQSVSLASSEESWMTAAAWASLSSEFHTVSEDKFLRFAPTSFLTPRATINITPAEELLHDLVNANEEQYRGIDVRDPSSLAVYEGEQPNWLTRAGQTRAVEEFISGHLCHHISLPEWKTLFDLEYIEMEVTYWLYILHLHLINRRLTSVPIDKFNRRRELMHDLLKTMFDSWAYTAEEVMGRVPLSKIKMHIQDMYYVVALNLEEALLHDGPGADLMLMGFLMKFCPLPRPEDVPMYTYYTLVHYIRFHTALFDRISDDTFAKGNFNFLNPTDARIFDAYNEIDYDTIIREWTVDNHEDFCNSTDNNSDNDDNNSVNNENKVNESKNSKNDNSGAKCE